MAIVPLSKAFNVILSLSGHHLVDKRRKPIWHKLQMTLIVLTMALGVYQSIWFLYNNVLRCGINLFMLRFMIWTFKGIIVQFFFLHFQFNGQIDKLKKVVISRAKKAEIGKRFQWLIVAIPMAFYLLLIVSGFVYFLMRMQKVVDTGYHFKYGPLGQIFIRNVMWWWTMWMVTVGLIFYNFCLLAVVWDIHGFVHKIEQAPKEETKSLFKEYLELLKKVECLDGTFKIYLFFMLGLSIPITITTLYRILRSPSTTSSSLHYLFIIPENIFCLFELFALTALAAKLDILLKAIPKAFFINNRIDGNGNNDGTELTNHFIVLNLTKFGLTVWGFATISKPMIMTVVSMLVTYLTLTLQIVPSEETTNVEIMLGSEGTLDNGTAIILC